MAMRGRPVRKALTQEERKTLRNRALMNKVLVMVAESTKSIPDIAKDLGLDPKILRVWTEDKSYPFFRAVVMDRIINAYLDIDKFHSAKDIADNLGITVRQLRYLTQTEEFRAKYDETYADIASSPGPTFARLHVLEDLLPLAMESFRKELSDDAPWTVRQNARRDVLKLAGVTDSTRPDDDRQEAAKFLTQFNVNILNISPSIPVEYSSALEKYVGKSPTPDVVDILPQGTDMDSTSQ